MWGREPGCCVLPVPETLTDSQISVTGGPAHLMGPVDHFCTQHSLLLQDLWVPLSQLLPLSASLPAAPSAPAMGFVFCASEPSVPGGPAAEHMSQSQDVPGCVHSSLCVSHGTVTRRFVPACVTCPKGKPGRSGRG